MRPHAYWICSHCAYESRYNQCEKCGKPRELDVPFKFKLEQKVRIISGTFRGEIGEIDATQRGRSYCYLVKVKNTPPMWYKEEELEEHSG